MRACLIYINQFLVKTRPNISIFLQLKRKQRRALSLKLICEFSDFAENRRKGSLIRKCNPFFQVVFSKVYWFVKNNRTAQRKFEQCALKAIGARGFKKSQINQLIDIYTATTLFQQYAVINNHYLPFLLSFSSIKFFEKGGTFHETSFLRIWQADFVKENQMMPRGGTRFSIWVQFVQTTSLTSAFNRCKHERPRCTIDLHDCSTEFTIS